MTTALGMLNGQQLQTTQLSMAKSTTYVQTNFSATANDFSSVCLAMEQKTPIKKRSMS
jgi:hypothetical protein